MRLALPTSVCAMLLDSKMRPRIVLRQAGQQVSIERALSACNKRAMGREDTHLFVERPTWNSAPIESRGVTDPLLPA